MSRKEQGCPSAGALAQAVSEGATAQLRAHLALCPRCETEWRGQSALLELGRHLPFTPPRPERLARTRAALLAGLRAAPLRGRPWTAALVAGAALAAAAVVLLGAELLAPPSAPPVSRAPVPQHVRRAAIITASSGAHFETLSGPPHELVRLYAGTIRLDVEPATRGETLRVITAGGEVEVKGTIFETTAVADRLVAVRVLRGRVAVHPAAGPPLAVEAGDRWTQPPPAIAPVSRRPAASDPAGTAFAEGLRLLKEGSPAAAGHLFDRAVTLAPSGPLAEEAFYWRAVALGRSGDRAAATHAIAELLARFPKSARVGEAQVIWGWLLVDSGRRAEAEPHFRAGLADKASRVRESARQGLNALGATN